MHLVAHHDNLLIVRLYVGTKPGGRHWSVDAQEKFIRRTDENQAMQ